MFGTFALREPLLQQLGDSESTLFAAVWFVSRHPARIRASLVDTRRPEEPWASVEFECMPDLGAKVIARYHLADEPQSFDVLVIEDGAPEMRASGVIPQSPRVARGLVDTPHYEASGDLEDDFFLVVRSFNGRGSAWFADPAMYREENTFTVPDTRPPSLVGLDLKDWPEPVWAVRFERL
jgi:hypothetical protein